MNTRSAPQSLRGRLLAAGAALAVTALPLTAGAQTLSLPRPRQGYYLGGGLHFATTHVTESDESLGVWPGQLFSLRTGEMLTNRFGLGLGAEYGGTNLAPDHAAFGNLSLQGQWEPINNLALHAGVGFGVVGLVDDDHPDDKRRGSYGGAYSLGVSYDWFPRPKRLSGGWALQPLGMITYYPDDPVSTLTFTLGLEVMRWRGLPKNELDLPAGEGYEKSKKRRDR